MSINEFYSQGHWSKRQKLKEKYKKIFTILFLEARLRPMEFLRLKVIYNSRHDVDNVTGLVKLFVDSLSPKYLIDDTKKYFQEFGIKYDPGLPKNTFDFYINEK